jgi:transcriptional regulator with XRE-family HTH domain
MISEEAERTTPRHDGLNVQKVRVYFGVKQERLAYELGISQSEMSKIEQQNEIDDSLLSRIAASLGLSPEVIRDFDLERAIYNINSYKDATISAGATTTVYAASQQINPIEKIVELYERLLQSEREKIDILKNH